MSPTEAPATAAVGTVLYRAHEALRHAENTLELEAQDPRVDALHRTVKAVRKAAAVALMDVAIAGSEAADG